MPEVDPAPSPATKPGASLLASLLDAIEQQDDPRLMSLLSENAALVMEAFQGWVTPPPQLPPDSAEYHRYINALYIISKTMSDCLGHTGLFLCLVYPAVDNPLARWERVLEAGQRLVYMLRADEAVSVLSNLLIDVRGLQGFAYQHMTATTHWYISQAHLHRRRRDDAVAHGLRALETTIRIQDHLKYWCRYWDHLFDIHRYFGDAGAAADCQDSLAELYDHLGARSKAAAARGRAAVVRRGEPLTRAVAVVNDVEFELDDIPPDLLDPPKLIGQRNRISLLPALELTREARTKQRAGEHEEALRLLGAAAASDHYAPEPHMALASILMAQEDYTGAARAYAHADQLAPGWPGSRHGQWLALQLAAGRFDPIVRKWLRDCNTDDLEPAVRLERVRQALQREPKLPMLHVLLYQTLREMGQMSELETCCRRGLACESDVDVRTWLLVELAELTAPAAERHQLLEEAVRLNGNLLSATRAKLLLQRQPANP
jgi:tetratricopeptide (TPR) repeat protein